MEKLKKLKIIQIIRRSILSIYMKQVVIKSNILLSLLKSLKEFGIKYQKTFRYQALIFKFNLHSLITTILLEILEKLGDKDEKGNDIYV